MKKSWGEIELDDVVVQARRKAGWLEGKHLLRTYEEKRIKHRGKISSHDHPKILAERKCGMGGSLRAKDSKDNEGGRESSTSLNTTRKTSTSFMRSGNSEAETQNRESCGILSTKH